VFHFSSLVLVGPQKCSFVWYTLKDLLAHSPTLLSGHLNYILVSLFLAEHAHHPVLLLATGKCLLCLVSSLVISLVGGACASCLLTWVWGTLTISYSRSHTTFRLDSWCDNCESIDGRMTKLLGMANSRGWVIALFPGLSPNGEEFVVWSEFCLVVCCGQFLRFCALIDSMFVSTFTFCLSTLWLSCYPPPYCLCHCASMLYCPILSFITFLFCLTVLQKFIISAYKSWNNSGDELSM